MVNSIEKSFKDCSGYTYSVEDAFSVIRKFEVVIHSKFVLRRESKNFGNEDIPKENKKIFWSDPQDNIFNDINLLFDGVPYIVGGKTLLTCHHGPALNKQKKQRAKLKKNQSA